MATLTAAFSTSGTLVANQVDTVTLTDNTSDLVEVYNSGSSSLYFTITGSDPDISTIPIKDCYLVPAGATRSVYAPGSPDTVKLKSTSTPTYTVTGQSPGPRR